VAFLAKNFFKKSQKIFFYFKVYWYIYIIIKTK